MTASVSDAPATADPRGGIGAGWSAAWVVALAASLVCCIHGLRSSDILTQILWSDPREAASVAFVVLVLLGALQVAARHWRLPLSMAYAAALLFVAAGFAGLAPVAAVSLLVVSAFALGDRVLGTSADAPLGLPLAAIGKVALGFALLSLAVFGLALTPFNNPFVYSALLLVPILWGWRRLRAQLGATLSAWRGWVDVERAPWAWAATLVVALAVSMRLIVALYPETGTDALAMHLVIADQLEQDGQFHFNVTQSVWAVMPMAGDWVLAAAHMLSGEAGARLANLTADLLLVGLVFAGAWRLRSMLAAWLAVVLYATTPLLFRESMTLYVENFWALWCCAGLLFGLLCLRGQRTAWLLAGSVLIGVAFAAKVVTLFFFLAFFLPLSIAWLFADWRRGLRSIGLCAIVIALAGAWPYLLAWMKTGNPVFPFYNALFQSPYYDASVNFENAIFAPGPAWRLLFDATFQSQRFIEGRPGAIGILLLLLAGPALVGALRERWVVRWGLLGSILFVVVVAHFQSYLRYWLPALPVLSVAMGVCIAGTVSVSRWRRGAMLLVVGVGAIANLYLTPASSWSDKALSVPPFHGSREWREIRHEEAPGTYAVDLLNGIGARRVLWFGDSGFGGAHADVFVTNWHGWAAFLQLLNIRKVDVFAHWIARNQIDTVVVSVNPNAPFGKAAKAFLARDTTLLAEHAGIRIYRVHEDVMFDDEKLENPGFDGGSNGWGGDGLAMAKEGTVRVSSTRPFSQAVPAKAGSEYLVQVVARCPAGSAGYRLQVNWLDDAGGFLDADIEVQPCTDAFEQHSMRVTAPLLARTALVYASGQDAVAMAEFDRVSFRE